MPAKTWSIPIQLQFNDKRDSQLIAEAMQEDPYSADDSNAVWEYMATNLLRMYQQDTPGLKVVLARTIKDRMSLLITHFLQDDCKKLSR